MLSHASRTLVARTAASMSAPTKRSVHLVPPAKVLEVLNNSSSRVIPVDASWYMPNVPVVGFHEFMKQRLSPDAVFFDIDQVSDPASAYPHMLPSKEIFQAKVQELGLKNDDELLLYDQQGIFSVCRAAWMFEIFGHDTNKIHIINTFPAFLQSFSNPNLVLKIHSAGDLVDKELVFKPSPHAPSDYTVTQFDSSQNVLYEDLLELVKQGKIGTEYTVIDARSQGRFSGADPEPRPGLSSGHIPGALNVPFTDLLTAAKSYLSALSMGKIFAKAGVDDSKPIIVMCGTGVTACVLRSGLQAVGLGSKGIAVYDGSWTEWAQRAPAELIVKD